MFSGEYTLLSVYIWGEHSVWFLAHEYWFWGETLIVTEKSGFINVVKYLDLCFEKMVRGFKKCYIWPAVYLGWMKCLWYMMFLFFITLSGIIYGHFPDTLCSMFNLLISLKAILNTQPFFSYALISCLENSYKGQGFDSKQGSKCLPLQLYLTCHGDMVRNKKP